RARIDAQRELAQIRVVDLQRRAVLARLGVVRAAQERPGALAEGALERGVDRGVARVRVRVDETALLLRNEDVAAGAEDVGGDVAAPRAAPVRGEERRGSGALGAGAGVERNALRAADELHDAAHGRGAVEVGGAAAEDLDT